MLGLLRGVPVLVWVVVAAVAWGAFQKHRASASERRAASQQLQQAQARADALQAGLVEQARILTEQQEAANAADKKTRRAAADAAGADIAGRGLRAYAAGLAASAAACGAAAAPIGPPGPGAAAVLADMLGSLEERGRALAAEADRRGIAGSECERRYDALTGAARGEDRGQDSAFRALGAAGAQLPP